MKKLFILMAMMLTAFCANAFDFDGIDLNSSYANVAQEISKRGYVYDSERNCLKGNCQGTEIYLSFNYIDVTKKNQVGQLIVEIPMPNTEEALKSVCTLFNVVYHIVAPNTYAVSSDGTQLVVNKKGNSIILTYNTPYYKKK